MKVQWKARSSDWSVFAEGAFEEFLVKMMKLILSNMIFNNNIGVIKECAENILPLSQLMASVKIYNKYHLEQENADGIIRSWEEYSHK